MKEEDEILRKCGTGNPFTVPESYFDHFRENVMSQLPEKEVKPFVKPGRTIMQRIRPWFYAAAVSAGLFIGTRYVLNSTSSDVKVSTPVHTEKDILSDQEVDALMDHSMMDDYSLYEYITDAE